MNVGKSVKVSQIHQHLAHMLIEINYIGWYCKRLWVSVIYYYLTCSSITFFGLFLSLKTYLFVLLVIDDEDRLCYHFHYIIAFSDPLGHHQLMYIHRRYQK